MNRLIFTFDDGDGLYYTNVYADISDPTQISFQQILYQNGDPVYPSYQDGDPVGSPGCQGTTLLQYRYQQLQPYANYNIIYNSPTCGYRPSPCDLTIGTFSHTNPTNGAQNDGTLKIFATSSNQPVLYQVVSPISSQNNYGYFINLAPGTYTVDITDASGCYIQQNIVIDPFDPTKTSYKYRLQFTSVKSQVLYELRFLDQKNSYDPLLYPKDLTGTDTPVTRKTTISNEDKTDAFAVSSLLINIYANGTTFQTSEFANSAERDWKIELYKGTGQQQGNCTFNVILSESITPAFVDGNVQLKFNNVPAINLIHTGSQMATGIAGQNFSIEAYAVLVSISPDPKLTFTIKKNGVLVYAQTVVQNGAVSLVYAGLNDTNAVYDILVSTATGGPNAVPVNIPDSLNYGKQLDWQGWLLPDEFQDFYADPSYPIQLTATDGLLSLQGSTFGDPAIYQIDQYGNIILNQLFGLRTIIYIIKICMDQLGYNYGKTLIISSLTYKAYKVNQWLNYATWIDIFYDQNGVPKDTYSSLQAILQALHLIIFQDSGRFVLWDINDISYRNTGFQAALLGSSTIEFANDFSSYVENSALPQNQTIGAGQLNKPINPLQTLNYDKAFNKIEADVSFNLLSLLYPNPSFEFNAIQGALPDGFIKNGTLNAYVNYDPPTNIVGSGAYDGNWELKVKGNWPAGNAYDFSNYLHLSTPIVIDQDLKKLNLSYVWRAYPPAPTFPNSLPVTVIIFIGGQTGIKWSWWVPANGAPRWQVQTSEPVGQQASPNIQTTDYVAWNQFSITTDQFPEGYGTLDIRICAPSYYYPGHDIAAGTPLEVDIDSLTLTISDTNDQYNFQTGEKHVITNSTSYAKAETKTVTLDIFTYPTNKRVSGNIAYGSTYTSSLITNEWFFALSKEQLPDRLPANVIKRIAKNYKRPMYKWQGDIFSDNISFYTVFSIIGIQNKIFIPFTIDMDLRNSTGNIVIIETDDSQMQASYIYTPIYQNSARNNSA